MKMIPRCKTNISFLFHRPLSIVFIIIILILTFLNLFHTTKELETSLPSSPSSLPDNKNENDDDHHHHHHHGSPTATVMAMATGYDLYTHKLFIESLRNVAGFRGNIILVVEPEPDVPPEVKDYLIENDVMLHHLERTECTYEDLREGVDEEEGEEEEEEGVEDEDEEEKERLTCIHPYPELKQRWSRFPLLRDHLARCKECTGPVLITDYRDIYFQHDPFAPPPPPDPTAAAHNNDTNMLIVEGLQLHVFEEHKSQTTEHWLIDEPVYKCKQIRFKETMLCSGTTIGTRIAMIEYLTAMYDEMMMWTKDPNCCCNKMNGDDQSIHNYLLYRTDRLKGRVDVRFVPNRKGIVNTVGVEGALIRDTFEEELRLSTHMAEGEIRNAPFPVTGESADDKSSSWIRKEYNLTNEKGQLTNFDGTSSRVVHQYDRLGEPFYYWLEDFVFAGEISEDIL